MGRITRGRLVLVADAGRDLELQGQFFVPDDEDYRQPEFLGYLGALRHFRVGIDPGGLQVYFGA